MKRFSLFTLILLALSLATALPTRAQDNSNLITLNDASPAIDVVVTLPADTTGTIALDFSGAAVRLTDGNGGIVFAAADARLHSLELNIAPNSGSHTLTVERLPGITEAVVRLTSLPELTTYGTVELVSGLALTASQEVSLPLTPDHPGDTVSLSLPGDSAGMITAIFPGAAATTQLVDAAGVVVVESVGGHVDGLSLLLDPGAYQFTLLSSALAETVVAGVRLVSAADVGLVMLPTPASTLPAVAANPLPCTAVVSVSSMNLRSGPGTGYTVMGYGYRNQEFVVGGQNPENNWLLVGLNDGSAWVSRSTVQTQGDCAVLTTFNVPLLDAQPAPLIITGQNQSAGSYSDDDDHGDDDHDDSHDDDHEGGEDGDD